MIRKANYSDIAPIVEYLKSVPFDVSRTKLYSAQELYGDFTPGEPGQLDNCLDTQVYRHYLSKGKQTNDIKESMARTLHDHGVYVALGEFFRSHNYLKCIGVMGGHAMLRTDAKFRQIVFLTKQLTEQGFCMLSGGGPGAMEATHLGAWMAGRNENEVEDTLRILSASPSFRDPSWLSTAFEVINKYPQTRYESLGIPTWLYGHEPSTPFATHIAKFFENSIRENHILTLPFGGIIYTPGSAGTMHEIFRDAEQNHYLSYGFSSPMIFLGTKFWTEEIPVYPLLLKLSERGKYKNLSLTLTDDPEEIIGQLLSFQSLVQEHPEAFMLQ
jgi:predicted Rossmann-fold nucleotide-binding protein